MARVVLLLLTLVVSGAVAQAQSLAGRVVDGVSDGGTITFVVSEGEDDAACVARELARRSRTLFGVEALVPPGDPQPGAGEARRFTLNGRTLGELLDAFVARDPRYEWHEEAGIINLGPVPAGDPGEGLGRWLDGRLWPAIDAHGILSVVRARLAVSVSSPVSSSVAIGKSEKIKGSEWSYKRFRVTFGGGTLRQFLNAAAVAHGGFCWQAALDASGGAPGVSVVTLSTLEGNSTVSAVTVPMPEVDAAATAAPRSPEGAGRPGAAPPTPAPRPRRVRALLPLDEVRLRVALEAVSEASGTPLGVELTPRPMGQGLPLGLRPGDRLLDLTGMEAKEAVGRLLEEAPGYEWFEADGVINVAPRGARENTNDILNRVVPEFEVRDATLDQLPPAIDRVLSKAGRASAAPRRMDPARTLTLSLHQQTVREILNAIVKARGRTSWSVEFHSTAPAYDGMDVTFSAGGYSASFSGWSVAK